MDASFHECSQAEFFNRVGPRDVHPSIVSAWPYSSIWKTRGGEVVGKTVDSLGPGKATPVTRYYLMPIR